MGFPTNRQSRGRGRVLDVTNAFNNVCHEGLLLKAVPFDVDVLLVRLVVSYLAGLFFHVWVEAAGSSVRPILGIPQSSILGPDLFILFTSDMYSEFDACWQYVDNTAIYDSCRNQRLQKVMNGIIEWTSKWSFELNEMSFKLQRFLPHVGATILPWSFSVVRRPAI